MKKIAVAFLMALSVPLSALATGWTKSCRSSDVVTGLAIGQFACNDPDGDTPALNVANCENFDVFYFVDLNGDATASTNTVQIRSCPSSTADADACWPIQNVTMTGATPAEAIYGAAAIWIYGDFNAAINNDPRVLIKCNGPH